MIYRHGANVKKKKKEMWGLVLHVIACVYVLFLIVGHESGRHVALLYSCFCACLCDWFLPAAWSWLKVYSLFVVMSFWALLSFRTLRSHQWSNMVVMMPFSFSLSSWMVFSGVAVLLMLCDLVAGSLQSPRWLWFPTLAVLKFSLALLLHNVRSVVTTPKTGFFLYILCVFSVFWVGMPIWWNESQWIDMVVPVAILSVCFLLHFFSFFFDTTKDEGGTSISLDHLTIGLVFVYLSISRAVLAFVEKEVTLEIPNLFQNFLRSFLAGFLIIATYMVFWVFRNSSAWVKEQVTFPTSNRALFFAQMFLFAILQSQLPVILIALSVHWVPFAVTSILIASTPLWSLLLGRFVFFSQPHFDVWQISAIVSGFCGALILSVSSLMSSQPSSSPYHFTHIATGIALALLAAIFWAVAGNLSQRFLSRAPLLPKTILQSMMGSVFALTLSFFTECNADVNILMQMLTSLSRVSHRTAWMLVFLVLGFSFLSLIVTVYLLDRVGAVTATAVWFVVPTVSLVLNLELGLLKSASSWQILTLQLLGCTLVFVALAFLIQHHSKKK